MAGTFDTRVEINTADAVQNLRNLRAEAKENSIAFREFNQALQESKQNVVLAAQQMTKLAQARAQNSRSSRDEAAALVAEARAQALATAETDKHNESIARQATERARAEQINSKSNETLSRQAVNQARATQATAQASLAQERQAEVSQRTATAQERAANSSKVLTDHLSNTRYLMYDVGAGLGAVAGGLEVLPGLTSATSISFEKDFAQVRRVIEDLDANGTSKLKDDLKALGTEIPKSFGDITEIAQLGSQMGIANDQLASFTDTTAKFAATTGMTNEATTQMFGRMESFFNSNGQIPDFFNKLGASVAKVGAETVATDPQIANMVSQIGAAGAQAGMSTPQIVGWAAAMASVRIQPELGRGFLTTVFNNINRAVADGGPVLDKWAKQLGVSSDEAAKMWKTDPSGFFNKFVGSLHDAHAAGVPIVTMLDTLGIKQVRYVDALQKLATGYDVVGKSMTAAQDGFDKGTFLNESSAKVFETVSAKLQMLANAWANVAETIGSHGLGFIGGALDLLTQLAKGADSLLHSAPGLAIFIQVLMGLAAVTGVFLAFKAAQAFVVAGLISFQQAAQNKGIVASMSLSGVLKELVATMRLVSGGSKEMGTGLEQASIKMRAMQVMAADGVGAKIGAGFQLAGSGVAKFGGALLSLAGGPVGIAVTAIGLLITTLTAAKMESEQAGKAIAEAMKAGASGGLEQVAKQLTDLKVTGADNLFFTFNNKNIRELGDEIGLSFDKIVSAASKGKAGMSELDAALEQIAKSKGYESLDAWANSADVSGVYATALRRKMDELAQSTDSGTKDSHAAADAVKKLGGAAADSTDGVDSAAESVDGLDKKLKDLVKSVFAVIDNESALQEALSKIGEGLQKGNSYDPMSEVGRTNIKNFEEGLDKAMQYYKALLDEGQIAPKQAAESYKAFVDGLIQQIRDKGGDPTPVIELANRTKTMFDQALNQGDPPTIPVKADTKQVTASMNQLQQLVAANPVTATLAADATPAQQQVWGLVNSLSQITGQPWQVVMDALTDPASEKGKVLWDLITSITNHTYTAPINADTSAAEANVRGFANYANQTLASLGNAFNAFLTERDRAIAGASRLIKDGGSGAPYKSDIIAAARGTQFNTPQASLPQAAPRAVAAIPTPNFAALNDGYDKAADKAERAGQKGKKAGQDAAQGFQTAAEKVADYANRLDTALKASFNQQYGLSKATDDYQSALNAIVKKRQDEVKQLDDLVLKQRQLNDERDKDLIDANKAKIEANISRKYGETDRAAEYDNQAQKSLDNAAAKQKEIDAAKSQADELRAGIGAFTGNTDAAIANRQALRDLEAKTLDMIKAYADQGHSQEEVRTYAQQLTAQFKTDAGQVFQNQTAIQNLTGDMGRYIQVINQIPLEKPTKVSANTGEATGAMQDFGGVADYNARNRDFVVNADTSPAKWAIFDLENDFKAFKDRNGDIVAYADKRYASNGRSTAYNLGGLVGLASGGMIPGTPPSDPRADNMLAEVDGRGLIKVRSREFIQPQEAVDYYGPDFMEAIRTRRLPRYSGGSGGSYGGGVPVGGGVTSLDAESIALLAAAVSRGDTILVVDNREIARAASRGARELGDEGARQ